MDDDVGVVFFWLAILFGFTVWSNWDSDNIVGHLRHQIAYGVSYSDVDIQARPKDCDFWGAPVGIKDCSYKPWVTAYNALGQIIPGKKPKFGTDTNTGKPILSYDDGKSWVWEMIWKLTRFGEPNFFMWCREGFDVLADPKVGEFITCSNFLREVRFHKKSLRILETYLYGYWDGVDSAENTPFMSVGQCSTM